MPNTSQKPNRSLSLDSSFQCAFQGLYTALKSERNLKIHTLISILVCAGGWYVGFSRTEWIALVLCITLMMATELMNTALEYTCNYIEPSIDERIRIIKDISAGACLIVALGCSVVGLFLFLPHF